MKEDKKNAHSTKPSPTAEKRDKKSVGTMNIILIVVGVALFAFTVEMIRVFLVYGAIPDTLCTCVFAALGGECGIMGMIKTTKEKYKDREWEREDRQRTEAANKTDPEPPTERQEPDDV